MEEYKSSKDFVEEVIEASGEAFDSDFASCKSLVGKLFFSLDLSSVTKEASLALAMEMKAQLAWEVESTVEVPEFAPEASAILITLKVELQLLLKPQLSF
ncbi:hypothetical protein COCNU_scaffold005347G000010 [Cocos nucifera]|nr:hypothetical protein [Cocos nucifera]